MAEVCECSLDFDLPDQLANKLHGFALVFLGENLVLAYGATGAGKTHTMLGSPEDPGVMYLTMVTLYKRMDQIKDDKTCDVAVSYLEVSSCICYVAFNKSCFINKNKLILLSSGPFWGLPKCVPPGVELCCALQTWCSSAPVTDLQKAAQKQPPLLIYLLIVHDLCLADQLCASVDVYKKISFQGNILGLHSNNL